MYKVFTTVTPLSKAIALVLFVTIPILTFFGGMYLQRAITPSTGDYVVSPAPIPPDGIACTMDARACPDGSFVGRIPPSCEFAPCPTEGVSSSYEGGCAKDLMTCPDGSVVGRDPDTCEFVECPEE